MDKFCALLFIILLTFRPLSQYPPGARQNALANSANAEPGDVFCLFANPALILRLPNQAGVYYSPAPFGLFQLRTLAAAGCYSTGNYSAAVGLTTYGFELYRQTTITGCAALPFLEEHQLGVSVNAYNLSISSYGAAWCLFYNAGILLKPFTNTRLSLSLTNLTRSSIGRANTPLPASFETGISYILYEFNFTAGIEKETDRLMTGKAGVSISPVNGFEIYAGYNSQPSELCGGISISAAFASFIYASRYHPILGFSHQTGIIIKY